jgi:pyruvate formate lyase activating enzyme
MCDWISETLGPDVPLHFSRFHPMYRLKSLPPTPVSTLERVRRTAQAAGLRFVYLGNVPGHPGESTACPGCGRRIIERTGYRIGEMAVQDGACAHCGTSIPGIWSGPAGKR